MGTFCFCGNAKVSKFPPEAPQCKQVQRFRELLKGGQSQADSFDACGWTHVSELQAAGFTVQDMRAVFGVQGLRSLLQEMGWSLKNQLVSIYKEDGMTCFELLEYGFTTSELYYEFDAWELRDAGVDFEG